MNKRTLLVSMLMVAASVAYAATPSVNVTVADASGKVAYKGRTNAAGTFATNKLQPGNYTVQFNSDNMSGDYAIVVSAGKKKVSADSVAGGKFAKGGVAMKVDVGAGLNITGQVAVAGAMTADGSGNSKVKIINGKRWYLVKGSTGSNLGEHWVEEGTPEARNLQGYSKDAVQHMQDRGSGALPGN